MTIEEFLKKLKRVSKRMDFQLDQLGRIRSAKVPGDACPISAIKGEPCWVADEVGEAIGLSARQVNAIVDAADLVSLPGRAYSVRLRVRLLAACGLKGRVL